MLIVYTSFAGFLKVTAASPIRSILTEASARLAASCGVEKYPVIVALAPLMISEQTMRFPRPRIGKAELWGVALGLAFPELAAGQGQPQWVAISDSVVANLAGAIKKPPSFE